MPRRLPLSTPEDVCCQSLAPGSTSLLPSCCIFEFYLYFLTGAYALSALSLLLMRKGLINLRPGPVQEGPQPLIGLFPWNLPGGTTRGLPDEDLALRL